MWWHRQDTDPYYTYYTGSNEKRDFSRFMSLNKVLISLIILCVILFIKKADFPMASAALSRVNQVISYEWDLNKLGDGLHKLSFLNQQVPVFKSLLREGESPPVRSGALIAPVNGRVTSGFGRRFHPLLKVERMHNGIDIEQVEGSPVKAAGDGTVMLAAEDAEMGRLIKIRHEGDLVTLYAHLKDVYVKAGDKVRKGQIIGTVGKTGLAENPHLHFEVWEKGAATDPERWIKIPEKP
ncbi:M23 family metallopeptidase [Thermosediminibacter oceani]|uniref:Peptidase M23 n=1 Tax=Thermosediminibacter oceani (strain ATCC BAA-1034 / DSM 16646 / JW/IW-1228P) TaxID=555079 RepID=D9S287_THEOJ|nr:M23 family metallopeptidase [Thermosediminibacter oceani]ADL07514.1 Peptidase M23 [Thermosediminibacter oceani DSM 16646]